jgi:hypothetical protein
MLTALAIDHRPPVSIARRSNGVRSFFPFGPSSNGGICRRRRVQIVFRRLKVPVPANPKTEKTRHHQVRFGVDTVAKVLHRLPTVADLYSAEEMCVEMRPRSTTMQKNPVHSCQPQTTLR